MKYCYLLVLLPVLSFSQIQITGTVKNDIDKSIIEFANVLLMNSEEEYVTGGITDENGNFEIAVDKGNYIIQVSFLGYADWSKNITVGKDMDLGLISLTRKEDELEQVTITAKKKIFEKKVDRLVFNVAESPSLTGGNAMDALQIAPRVRIEGDKISMIGKDNMRVMIDGKILQITGDNLSTYLNSIATDDIKKIEIITTPPAMYSAEGNSGLINIVYKKGRKNSWNSTVRGVYRQYTFPMGGLGFNFNYNKNKLSIANNLSFTHGSKVITDASTVFYENQTWASNAPRRVFYKPVLSGKISLDYQLSKSVSIGTQYLGEYNKLRITERDDTRIINTASQAIDSLVKTTANSLDESPSHSFNTYAEFRLDSLSKTIKLNFDYFTYQNDKERNYTSGNYTASNNLLADSFNAGHNFGNQKIQNYSGKIDVVLPLKKVDLNFGSRVSLTKTDNDIRFYNLTSGVAILDSNQSNQFDFEENTQAIYFSASKSFGEQWEAQVGLRYENTQTTGISVQLNQKNENDYDRIFPTVYVSYTPNDKNNVSLSYSSRIRRPSFEFLNPFRIIENQYMFVEGNPFLEPSFSDNVELSHTYAGKWVNGVYYSKTTNGFSQVLLSDPNTNIQQIIPLNYYDSHSYGFMDSYSFSPFSWWDSYTSLDVFYSNSSSRLANVGINEWELGAYFSTNNTWTLNKNKTVFLSTNFALLFPTSGQLFSTKQNNSLDIALKFSLMDKKLQIALSGNDVFSSYRPQYKEVTNGINIEYNNYYDNRNFRFSMSYKFGNSKIRTKRRKFGNQAEKRRVSN